MVIFHGLTMVETIMNNGLWELNTLLLNMVMKQVNLHSEGFQNQFIKEYPHGWFMMEKPMELEIYRWGSHGGRRKC